MARCAPDVAVSEVSTTEQATKDGEEICPTGPKVDEDEARLISESVVVGRTTGINGDDSADKPVEPGLDTGHT